MKSKAVSTDHIEEPLKKKYKSKAGINMGQIEEEMEVLRRKKDEIYYDVRAKMQDRADRSINDDVVVAFLEINKYEESQWKCSVCATDFTPMMMTNHDVKPSEYLYHCEKCGVACCFRDVIRLLCMNPICADSIGYPCVQCRFFNCNKVKSPPLMSFNTIDEYPFPSGHSSVERKKIKGDKLITSNYFNPEHSHEKNMKERDDIFGVHREYDDGAQRWENILNHV